MSVRICRTTSSATGSEKARSRSDAAKALRGCVVLFAVTLVAGCSTLSPKPSSSQAITPAMLLEARPIVGDRTLAPLPDVDVLALDEQALDFLESAVSINQSDRAKLYQLVRVIMDNDNFGVEYDSQTHTAIETFESRSGNCLSFTNLFVAMARHVGLNVRFQEVDIPPDWTIQGDSFVLNRHINAQVKLKALGNRVVDFNNDNFQANYEQRFINDQRALAHYYNNIGVERMLAGETDESLQNFRKSINYARDFSPPWANLGTLYRRNGNLKYAEAAFLYALRTDSSNLIAMSNLTNLYEGQGNADRAAVYQQRVDYHRRRNPYYRYRMGQKAFMEEDYEEAINQLRGAIRLQNDEPSFYFMLGRSYLALNETDKGMRLMQRAKKVAQTESLKRGYSRKMERLLSPTTLQ